MAIKTIKVPTQKTGNSAVPMLYKYMPWDFALSMLKNDCLYFSNPCDWRDRYEKKVLNGKFSIKESKARSYPLKDVIFATCFTSEYSCEAQWKMYLPAKPSNNATQNVVVEIAFNRKRLFEALSKMHKDIYFGKVVYYPQNELQSFIKKCFATKDAVKALLSTQPLAKTNVIHLLKPLLFKRKAFAYENEWRLFVTAELLAKNNTLYIPDLKSCIDYIVVDFGKLSPSEGVLKKRQLANVAPGISIRQTSLFDENSNVITFKIP